MTANKSIEHNNHLEILILHLATILNTMWLILKYYKAVPFSIISRSYYQLMRTDIKRCVLLGKGTLQGI